MGREFFCMIIILSSEETASHIIYVEYIFGNKSSTHLKEASHDTYHGFIKLRKRWNE